MIDLEGNSFTSTAPNAKGSEAPCDGYCRTLGLICASCDSKADRGSGGQPRGRMRRPPGVLFHVMLAAPLSAILVSSSWPGFDFSLWLQGVAAGLAVALWWVVLLIRYAVAEELRAGKGWRFWVAPAFTVLALVAVAEDVPLRVRWEFSEDAFTQAARAIEQSPESARSHIGMHGLVEISKY